MLIKVINNNVKMLSGIWTWLISNPIFCEASYDLITWPTKFIIRWIFKLAVYFHGKLFKIKSFTVLAYTGTTVVFNINCPIVIQNLFDKIVPNILINNQHIFLMLGHIYSCRNMVWSNYSRNTPYILNKIMQNLY